MGPVTAFYMLAIIFPFSYKNAPKILVPGGAL
jgi:hypothetical protein